MPQPAPQREAAQQNAYRRIYPLRVIGMGLGGLSIAAVLIEQQAARGAGR